ncbi:uncharacterized protein [Dermacentor andersoni]|uniref:uncharacterized protein isoform X1 n=1 Tax=Dermacentor andersoni TaxID=34620 RepID=UPI0021550ECF|nr:uncharacterized protein LOC126529105 isoform X1 [Dermacentor andersoni]
MLSLRLSHAGQNFSNLLTSQSCVQIQIRLYVCVLSSSARFSCAGCAGALLVRFAMDTMEEGNASSRPHRKCADLVSVRRLSQEAISGMLDDLSDSMDDPDDPDFMLEPESHHKPQMKTPTKRLRRPSSGSSSTSNDSDLSAKPPKKAAVPLKQVGKPCSGTIITVVKPGFSLMEDANITQHTPTTHGSRYICCVRNCASRGLSNLDGLWLFPLPQDDETRRLWTEEVPIDLEGNRPASPRVCFRHFDSSKFVRRQQRLLGLQKGAVPSATAGTALPSASSNSNKYARKSMLGDASKTPQSVTPTSVAVKQSSALKPLSTILPKVTTELNTKGPPIPVSPPIVGSTAASSASSIVQPSKAKSEIFIDLTSDDMTTDVEADVGKSQLAAMLRGTLKEEATSLSRAGQSSLLTNGSGPSGSVDEDCYELTLEDIEEELPWVVPDMHWDSDLKDGRLHLVWCNSPDQESSKKVILDKDLRVSVYIGKKQVVLGVQKITTIASLKQLFIELGKI